MTYRSAVLSSLMVCLLSAGCVGEASRRDVSGVQHFCVEPASGPEGPTLEVSVAVEGCFSGSCETVISSECSAVEVDGVFQLEASAIIESTGGNCSADCQTVWATCSVPVEEGESYVFRGDDGDEVEIAAGANEGACSVE